MIFSNFSCMFLNPNYFFNFIFQLWWYVRFEKPEKLWIITTNLLENQNAPLKMISTHFELVGVAGRWWQYKSSGGDGNVGTSNKINQLYFRKSVQVNWLDQNWMSENFCVSWFKIKSRLMGFKLIMALMSLASKCMIENFWCT